MDNAIKTPRGHWRHRFASEEVYLWTSNKWATVNQRTVNGLYVKGSASSHNPQHQSYLKAGIKMDINKEDFYDFCSDNEQKILEMMAIGDRPSIDRIDTTGDYTLDNIQIIPLMTNLTKNRNRGEESNHVSTVGSPLIRLRNRKVYLATHPDTPDVRFSDKLLEIGSPSQILKAIGIWDYRIDEPYDELSTHYGYYLEVLGALLEEIDARKALVDLQAKIKAQRALKKAQKDAILSEITPYHRLKAWAKSCPEYAAVYMRNQRLGMYHELQTTAQRQTMIDLQAIYSARGEYPTDLLQ